MATPLGHALAGAAVGRWSAGSDEASRRRLALWAALLAVAPDLDFLPGLLFGDPARFHQGLSHSVGAAVAVGLVVAGVSGGGGALSFKRRFAVAWSAWMSHLVIDYFGADHREPAGFPALWPLTEARFLSPRPLLPGVRHGEGGETELLSWVGSVFVRENVLALAVELSLFGALLWTTRRRVTPDG